MARLRLRNMESNGGWVYHQAETGAEIRSDNLESLVQKVSAHRGYKALPRPEPELVRLDVERQICDGLDERYCSPEPGDEGWPYRRHYLITLEQIIQFTRATIAWLASGEGWADKKTAAGRAAICRSCPLNLRAHACNCSPLFALIDRMVPAERRETGLFVCHACGCSLPLKVLLPAPVLRRIDQNHDSFPAYCWQRQEGSSATASDHGT